MTSTLSFNTVLGGRYRLTERIATGGQGEVWHAEDTALGRPTALKVLRGEYAGDADFRERFRREAQHAAMLSHPGIAQVFDYNEGDHGTPPYLVMEYVDGESLSAAIAREAPMSHDRVLDIIIAAASALAAAHAAGLVHRDVKPGNLLLGRDGSIKITDFGIARVMDASPLTRTGILMGTPLYLSPEQATGMGATAASDLYALGILAYEMLVGSPPYEGPQPLCSSHTVTRPSRHSLPRCRPGSPTWSMRSPPRIPRCVRTRPRTSPTGRRSCEPIRRWGLLACHIRANTPLDQRVLGQGQGAGSSGEPHAG